MQIIGPHLQRAPDCAAVLRTLPRWFGIERALLMYAADTTKLHTFAVEHDARLLGFLTLREHFPRSWEVHCMAVAADVRGKGLGSRLLAHSEEWLRERGVEFLQVKTVAATGQNAEHEQTRKYYETPGFTPLDILPDLWGPWSPALQCIKRLHAV